MEKKEVKFEEIELKPYRYGLSITYNYFTKLDKITIAQLNKEKEYFSIRDNNNEKILYALLETKNLHSWFCICDRSFNITIYTFNTRPFLRIVRDFKPCACCSYLPGLNALSQKVRVETPDGTVIGTISDRTVLDNTKYELNDINGNTFLIERSPITSETYEFKLWTPSKDQLLGITSRSPLFPKQEVDFYSLNCKNH